MIIRCCKECPFFRFTVLALFAGGNSGVCGYSRDDETLVTGETVIGMEPGPAREAAARRAVTRMPILNSQEVPSGCPLRVKDITLTLAKN